MVRIRIQLKGTAEPPYITTDDMSEEDAERAFAHEIPSKLGTGNPITLPGITVLGRDVLGAQKVHASGGRATRLA